MTTLDRRARGCGSARRRLRAATLLVLGLVVLGGCRSPLSLQDNPADSFDDEAEELVGRGDLLPAALPDDLLELQPSSSDGLPLVGFYAPGEPIVTVCTGPTEQCEAALPTEALLRELQVDGRAARVTLGGTETASGAPPPMSPSTEEFWSTVEFVNEPDWLPEP